MTFNRRNFVKLALASSMLPLASQLGWANENKDLWMRKIPSSGEMIPAVGMGTWITFNVGNDQVLMDECADVMEAFFNHGGTMIDSSPMYGSAQQTIGYGLNKLGAKEKVFSTDKIWTSADESQAQLGQTTQHWGVDKFNLLQVHNLVDWQANLEILKSKKETGDVNYIGITTSHGRRHGDLADVMESQPIDFVQLTYNIADREVENRLLPIAREKGIAVIANRPYRRGGLIQATAGKPLPEWASAETGAQNWAQFLLKFVLSHPDVTCAIPATSKVEHVVENMKTASGILPDEKTRQKMAAYFQEI